MLSSTIELILVQVSDRSRTSQRSYRTLFAIPPHPPIIEKLWSKGVSMHIYGISVYYTYTGSQLNGHGRSHSKWTLTVKLGLNFIIHNESCFLMPKKLKKGESTFDDSIIAISRIACVQEFQSKTSTLTFTLLVSNSPPTRFKSSIVHQEICGLTYIPYLNSSCPQIVAAPGAQ